MFESSQASMGGPSPNRPYHKNERNYGPLSKMVMGFVQCNGDARPVPIGVGGRLQKLPDATSDESIIRYLPSRIQWLYSGVAHSTFDSITKTLMDSGGGLCRKKRPGPALDSISVG